MSLPRPLFTTCPLLYLVKYHLLLNYCPIPNSSAVTKLKVELVPEKGLSFEVQASLECCSQPWLVPTLEMAYTQSYLAG